MMMIMLLLLPLLMMLMLLFLLTHGIVTLIFILVVSAGLISWLGALQ